MTTMVLQDLADMSLEELRALADAGALAAILQRMFDPDAEAALTVSRFQSAL